MTTTSDLTGRVALVTGGGTGVGAATARLFAQQGAKVMIAARTVAELERTAASVVAETGADCRYVPTDVKVEGDVVAMVDETLATFGRIDILVNNAGGTRMGLLKSLPTKAWDSIFDLNVKSAYLATREAGKHFVEQRSGTIVNISSMAGVTGIRGGAHYASSKSALQMLTRVTAAEWGPFGVRANCLALGAITSERVVDAWKVAGLDADRMAGSVPLRRLGTPEEVANAILFFASDASSYISGETIAVSGGPSIGGIDDV
jgi:NAD(P)-dependent dehydrogenase (short-subunit alcohol dehydrogenase family)